MSRTSSVTRITHTWGSIHKAEGHVEGLVQDCSNPSALAMELLQSCTKPSMLSHVRLVARLGVRLLHISEIACQISERIIRPEFRKSYAMTPNHLMQRGHNCFNTNIMWSRTRVYILYFHARCKLMKSLGRLLMFFFPPLQQMHLYNPTHCVWCALITSTDTCHWSLTHWGRVTHICVSKLTILGSDNGLSPSHYLNQCWNIVNWTLENKFQWNVNRNSYIFIQENAP